MLRRSAGARICALVLMASVATPGSGQERFSDALLIREIQVPVRVLVKGRPLAGLTIDNFEIYDRGVEQTLTALTVRHLGEAAETPALPLPDVLPGGVDSLALGRSLLVLVDFGFSGRNELARALEGIETMIDTQLQSTDRVAIATWGPISGLNILTGFTSDRAQISLAVSAVQGMLDAKRRPQLDALEALHQRRFGSASSSASTYEALARELGPTAALTVLTGPVEYGDEEDEGVDIREQSHFMGPIKLRVEVDVRKPIDTAQDRVTDPDDGMVRILGLSLAELASLLRDIGGQKEVFLLSEGFGGTMLTGSRSLLYLEKAMRAFRDGGWTMHAIDVGGVPTIDEVAFDSDSLLYMTKATGGELVENVSRVSVAAERVLRRTEIVYLLSFQPSDPGFAGDLNKLEIKLRNAPRGAKVIHRAGYYSPRHHVDKESYEQRVDIAQWLLSNEEVREMPAQVFAETVVHPEYGSLTSIAVEIRAEILYAIRKRRKGDLELWVSVLDEKGLVRDVQMGNARLRLKRLEKQGDFRGLRFVGDLGVTPGQYRLRVLARHRKGGEVFLSTVPLSATPGPSLPTGPIPTAEDRPDGEWITVQITPRSAFFR